MCIVYLRFCPGLLPLFSGYLRACIKAAVWPWGLKATTLALESSWVSPRFRYFSRVCSASGSMFRLVPDSLDLDPVLDQGHQSLVHVAIPNRHCSVSSHCTWLTCSWPLQTSSSAQSRTHLISLLFAWNDLIQTKYLFSLVSTFWLYSLLNLSLSMIISWFCHFSLVHLYLHRYLVSLSPIQSLIRAPLNSFSVLFTVKMSSTTSSHLMSNCSKHAASQFRWGFLLQAYW